MCLFISEKSESSGSFKAEEDIVVYKLVTRERTDMAWWCSFDRTEGSYYSPYRGQAYELGAEYSSIMLVNRNHYDMASVKNWGVDDLFIKIRGDRGHVEIAVVEHGLHTFANYEEAKAFYEHRCALGYFNYHILKCVIPAGSECYLGKWVYNSFDDICIPIDSYASSNLRVIEEII